MLESILRQGAIYNIIYRIAATQQPRIEVAKREAKPIVDKIDVFWRMIGRLTKKQ